MVWDPDNSPTWPSDLLCNASSIPIIPKSKRDRSSKLAKYEERRNEEFSEISYKYKPASAEDSSDMESILPMSDSPTPPSRNALRVSQTPSSKAGSVRSTTKSPPPSTRGFVRPATASPSSLSTADDSSPGMGTVIYTPMPAARNESMLTIARNQSIHPAARHESILGFDPLSSFTVLQTDKPARYEISYVEQKAYPTTIRQVHGSLSLHNEQLIQAITDVAGNVPEWEKIKVLDLSGKGLTSLHNLEKYCPSLCSLDIDDNNIEHLTGCPPKLRALSANNNRLSNMTSWGHLPHLVRVKAAGNNLEDLNGLAELWHLIELDVSRNRLQDVKAIYALMDLRAVDLSHNFIEELKCNWVMKHLAHLNVSYNRLWFVDNLDVFPRLETLNLEGNTINSFGEATDDRHEHLRQLNLKQNSVMGINLRRFPVLQYINLDENLLLSANSLDGLEDATSLIKLSLRAQQESRQGHANELVNTILSTRFDCSELYLSENLVPGGIMNMPEFKHYSIRTLELALCGIEQLPTNFGYYFCNCRTLNLNSNDISEIQQLRGMSNLQELHLARNQITKLKDTIHVMSDLPRLQRLDIRDNCANNGWYNCKPGSEMSQRRYDQGPYELPKRHGDLPNQPGRVSSTTKYHKMVMHLLLVEHCHKLREFDGANWTSTNYIKNKEIRQELMDAGYYKPRASSR